MGTATARASVNWSGSVTVGGEYASDASFLEGARGEPRRDRNPRVPHAARARDRVRRRVLGGRPGGRARARGGRGVPRRARPCGRELPPGRRARRHRAAGGAEAVHPGYGFLAENAAFARAVEEAGLTWIGPPPAAIELMGSKTAARAAMRAAGVPIIPGAVDPVDSAGGGRRARRRGRVPADHQGRRGRRRQGHGDRPRARRRRARVRRCDAAGGEVLRRPDRLRRALRRGPAPRRGSGARRRARERDPPRRARLHDPATPPEARRGDAVAGGRRRAARPDRQIAVDAARAAGYRSAGTIEGLLTRDGEYFFMEMNTRIQVEHTVTELVTGLDLIREQVLVAAGEPLSVRRTTSCCAVTRSSAGSTRRTCRALPAGAGADHRLPRAGRAGRPRRLRDRGGRRGQRAVRPDDREAHRPRRRPRPRDRAHAARPRGVPDRGAADPARLPPCAARAPVLRAGETCAGVVESKELARARAGARGGVLSSDNECDGRRGRSASRRSPVSSGSRSTAARTTCACT